jgi:hypothetical protein
MILSYSDAFIEDFLQEYPNLTHLKVDGIEYSIFQLYPFLGFEDLRIPNEIIATPENIFRWMGYPSHDIPDLMTVKDCLDSGVTFIGEVQSQRIAVFKKGSWYCIASIKPCSSRTIAIQEY